MPIMLGISFVFLLLFIIAVISVHGATVAFALFLFFFVAIFLAVAVTRYTVNKQYLEPRWQYAVIGVFVLISLFGFIVGVSSQASTHHPHTRFRA